MESVPLSPGVEEQLAELDVRANPPRVSLDNKSDSNASVLKVDSANKRGTLLEIVQVLMDMNLMIRRVNISTDEDFWFLVVVHVTDQNGKKLSDSDEDGILFQILIHLRLLERLKRYRLEGTSSSSSSSSQSKNKGEEEVANNTAIELTGRDRPGILSEIFAVLATHNCNVAAAHVWTHNSRMAAVIYFTDNNNIGVGGGDAPRQIDIIMEALLHVLRNGMEEGSERVAALTPGNIEFERRLHQLMSAADGDADVDGDDHEHFVKIWDCADREYTVVTLRCPDRPKLHFDTIFALTDMEYMIYHGTVVPDGPKAVLQEYFIQHKDGYKILSTDAEKQRVVVNSVEAAIKRRSLEGAKKVELKCEAYGIGLTILSDLTRILGEKRISIVHAEVAGSQAAGVDVVFHVKDSFSAGTGSSNQETTE